MSLTYLRHPGPDDQDIAVAELYTLVARHLLHVFDRDAVAIKRVVWLGLGFHVRLEVDQDAPADKPAASMPVIDGGLSVLGGGLGRGKAFLRRLDPIVCQSRGLVLYMNQTVPLAAELRVELELIVPAVGTGWHESAG